MTAYMVVVGNNRSTDWLPDYVNSVPTIFRKFGGEYVGVGARIKQLEGADLQPNMTAIFSFPTLADVENFMNSDEYRPFAELRRQNMDAMIVAFDTEG